MDEDAPHPPIHPEGEGPRHAPNRKPSTVKYNNYSELKRDRDRSSAQVPSILDSDTSSLPVPGPLSVDELKLRGPESEWSESDQGSTTTTTTTTGTGTGSPVTSSSQRSVPSSFVESWQPVPFPSHPQTSLLRVLGLRLDSEATPRAS